MMYKYIIRDLQYDAVLKKVVNKEVMRLPTEEEAFAFLDENDEYDTMTLERYEGAGRVHIWNKQDGEWEL